MIKNGCIPKKFMVKKETAPEEISANNLVTGAFKQRGESTPPSIFRLLLFITGGVKNARENMTEQVTKKEVSSLSRLHSDAGAENKIP
jgi:hypothetical protein